MNTQEKLLTGLGLLVVLAVVYLLWNGNSNLLGNNVEAEVVESFYNQEAPADMSVVSSSMEEPAMVEEPSVNASEPLGENEQPKGLDQTDSTQVNQLPSECYPKDVLSSADLLPRDADSLYAQVNPSGQGSLADQNFLTAGYHIGINTVGQTLRNANRQLRSEPPNPQVKVSPWQQTTIEPDINRRPLEIAGEQ
jgi:hypothetical protein